jgi:hypothetical protein
MSAPRVGLKAPIYLIPWIRIETCVSLRSLLLHLRGHRIGF